MFKPYLSSFDSSLPLENLTTTHTHTSFNQSAAISSFPYTKDSSHGRIGSMPQNKWYDEDCWELYRNRTYLHRVPDIRRNPLRAHTRREAAETRSQVREMYHCRILTLTEGVQMLQSFYPKSSSKLRRHFRRIHILLRTGEDSDFDPDRRGINRTRARKWRSPRRHDQR